MSTNLSKRKRAGSDLSKSASKLPGSEATASDEKGKSMVTSTSCSNTVGKTLLRRCLSSAKYIFAILLIPPFLNYAALLQEGTGLLPPGVLYDIGFGQKMYLGCNGTGSPTVIFDAPTGMSSDVWNLVFTEVTKITKACVYDRAGLGFSTRPFKNHSQPEAETHGKNRWKDSTVESMVDDLHTLITYSSQQDRPLLLVGAEIGSLIVRFYAQVYESDVTDIVLVDPLTEDLFTYDSDMWTKFWWHQLIPSWQAMHLSAAFGISRLALMIGMYQPPLPQHDSVPDRIVRRQKHLLCNPRHVSSVVDELYFINDTFSQMQTVFRMKAFPSNVSVSIISSETYDAELPSDLNEVWKKSQYNLASKLHPNSQHIFADNVDHNTIYWHHPEIIVERIRQLVHRHRYANSQAQ